MRIANLGISGDSYYTGLAVNFNDMSAFWQNLFPNSLRAPSVIASYPKFDDNMQNFRNIGSAQFRKVGNSLAPVVNTEGKMETVEIRPYHVMADWVNETDIKEGELIGVDPVQTQMLGAYQILSTQIDVDLFNLFMSTDFTASPVAAVWTGTSGNPELDVRTVCDEIEKDSGGKKRPNTMIISREAFTKMITSNNLLRSRLQYVMAGAPTATTVLPQLFELDRVIVVPTAINAAKANATKSMSAVWGANAWIGYLETNNMSKAMPSAVYPVATSMDGANQNGIVVTKLDTRNNMTADGQKGIRTKIEIYTNFFNCSSILGRRLTGIYT